MAGHKISEATLTNAIETWCRDLTAETPASGTDALPEHFDDVVQAVIRSLAKNQNVSSCIIGEAGSGKSTLIGHVAQRLAAGKDVPSSLQGARVLMLDMDRMRAGSQFRGQLEERLKPLVDGLREREGVVNGRKIILAFDELTTLLGDAPALGGSGAGTIMKSLVTAKGIGTLTAATPREYAARVRKDPTLDRRFEQIAIPSREQYQARKMSEIFTRGAERPVPIMQPLVLRRRGFSFVG